MQSAPADPDMRWILMVHDLGKIFTRSVQDGKVHFFGHEQMSVKLFQKIARRFHFPEERRQKILHLVASHMRPNLYQQDWTDSAVRRFMKEAGDYLDELLVVAKADITSRRIERVKAAINRLSDLQQRIAGIVAAEAAKITLPKNIGNEIMVRFKLTPGPVIGQLKDALIETIERGELPADQDNGIYLDYLAAHPELFAENRSSCNQPRAWE
jgi:poly(A) polymerase